MYNTPAEALVTGIRDTEKRAIIDIDVKCGNDLCYAGEIGVWRSGKFNDASIFGQNSTPMSELDRTFFNRSMGMVTFLRSMFGIAPFDRDFDTMCDIANNLPFLMDPEHWDYNLMVTPYRSRSGNTVFQPTGFVKYYKPIANEVRAAYLRGYKDAIEKMTAPKLTFRRSKKSNAQDNKSYGEDYLRLYDSMANIPEPVPEMDEEPVYPSERVRSMV